MADELGEVVDAATRKASELVTDVLTGVSNVVDLTIDFFNGKD